MLRLYGASSSIAFFSASICSTNAFCAAVAPAIWLACSSSVNPPKLSFSWSVLLAPSVAAALSAINPPTTKPIAIATAPNGLAIIDAFMASIAIRANFKPFTSVGKIISKGPMAAAKPATTTTAVFAPSLIPASFEAKLAIESAIFFTIGSKASPMEMPKASTELRNRSNPPCAVSSNIFRAFNAAPVPSSCFCVSSAYFSELFCRIGIILPARSPNTSKACVVFSCPVVKASSASVPVMPSFANVTSALVKDVPAVEASTPELTKAPNAAPVCSTLKPIELATDPTVRIDTLNCSRSNALLPNSTAMLSTIRPLSLASNPNWFSVAPTTRAVSPSSVSKATDKDKTPSVICSISVLVFPSLASSNCKDATSDALREVVAPSSCACASSLSISAAVNPETACTLAMLNSKSDAAFTANAPSPKSGAVKLMLRLFPICVRLPVV